MLSIHQQIWLTKTYGVCINKVVEIAGGVSAIIGATPSSFTSWGAMLFCPALYHIQVNNIINVPVQQCHDQFEA